jgi:hypothetical protein
MMRGLLRWSLTLAGVVLYVYADDIADLVLDQPVDAPAPVSPPGSPAPAAAAPPHDARDVDYCSSSSCRHFRNRHHYTGECTVCGCPRFIEP